MVALLVPLARRGSALLVPLAPALLVPLARLVWMVRMVRMVARARLVPRARLVRMVLQSLALRARLAAPEALALLVRLDWELARRSSITWITDPLHNPSRW